jgi:arsenate reductase
MHELSDIIRGQRNARVLFICVRNTARSQIAEALFNERCGRGLTAESAGLEPGELNPLAVATLQEIGIDISGKQTQSVFDLFKSGRMFSYVITVCDEASAERCPIFPGVAKRLHWSIPDPAALTGTWERRLETTRAIREMIRARVDELCDEICPQVVG